MKYACYVCAAKKKKDCVCHMYEWGPCIHKNHQWAPHEAYFLKDHVGDPDFYASC